VAIASEDSSAVTPSIVVDEIYTFLERVSTHNEHNGSKDFFFVAVDASPNIVNDGRTNEIAFWVSFNLDTTTVEKKAAVFVAVRDQSLNFGFVLCIL